MRTDLLSPQSKADRAACLTLVTDIRNILEESRTQVSEHVSLYEATAERLKYLNDYANVLYNNIQTGIFRNGGENYITILRYFGTNWDNMTQVVAKKYKPTRNSDWDSRVIFGLFLSIAIFAIIAILLNLVAFKFMPRRMHTPQFLKKRACIIWATTTITVALILGVLRNTLDQNFFFMASLISVLYISLYLLNFQASFSVYDLAG
jgi:hypothetical protein